MKGEISAEVVGNGVGDPHVFEGTCGNIVVVFRVTPTPETIIVRVGPDSPVVKVRSV